jgi:amino acid adenylation domain-containing protein
VLLRELLAFYESDLGGEEAGLAPLSMQYADFARQERETLTDDLLERQLAYWRRHLEGAPPLTELPTDRPRPALQTYRGAAFHTRLAPPLATALRSLARNERATLYMTLLAAFAALLHRYTGQEDLVVGSPVANRQQVATEALIGFFVNVIVVRADAAGDPAFRELLRRVRDAALGAYENQDLPFEKLVAELDPARSSSHAPLFQAMFTLQNFAPPPLKRAGVKLRFLDVDSLTSEYDLGLNVRAEGDELRLVWRYSTDLFEETTVRRMAEHYERLLHGIVSDPDARLSELPLLSDDERRRIVTSWNDTATNDDRDRCIHHLVADRAARAPDRVALVFGDDRLTYRQLDARANRTAQRLTQRGVGQGSLVALTAERSLDMVVGLLGILKAGAAYVPLDPTYPPDRLAFMIDDAKPVALLTRPGAPIPGAPSAAVPVVELDDGEAEESPVVSVGPGDPAYVIYTSGSTGRPKGVVVPHRAVVNLLLAMREEPGFAESDSLLAVTTLSFDIAVLELLLPLVVGGRVVLASREAAADGERLAELLDRSEVTVMQATPATWHVLLEAGWRGDGELKILCGGEALPRDLANRLLDCGGSLWNLYGPTETTVWSLAHRVRRGEGTVPIGRPIANTTVYLLDPQGHPVPVGVAAELYLGGAGLAQGYAGQPELTALRFVPHPFSADPKARLYRTGDLARYRPDGTLEFLGRVDRQIKLRGFRIELEEIESALRCHDAVGEAVVVETGERPTTKRLLAYVTPASRPSRPDADTLREFLQESLPDYMVPSQFVTIARIPRTPNRKVDRTALPPPDGTPDSRDGSVAETAVAGTPWEMILAEIWREVLEIESVGIHDSFYDLGGHSLLAVHVAAAVRERTGFEMNPRLLVRHTLAQLAAVCAERQPLDGVTKHGTEPDTLLRRFGSIFRRTRLLAGRRGPR